MPHFSRVPTLALLPLAALPAIASAGDLSVQHDPVGCVVAERYPVVTARVDPAADVARARVYFRAAGESSWYYVAMKADGDSFAGTLPMPSKATPRIEYYVEAIDQAFAVSRTPDYSPLVVADAGQCQQSAVVAAAVTGAEVVVGAVAGAPAVPVGFSPLGIASVAGGSASGAAGATSAGGGAAAGGLSTGVIAGIAGGVAAAAAVGVAAGGGSGESTSSVDLSGRWSGPFNYQITSASQGVSVTCTVNVTITANLTHTGTSVTGTNSTAVTGGTCAAMGVSVPVVGRSGVNDPWPPTTASNGSMTFSEQGVTYTGTYTSSSMNGTISGSLSEGGVQTTIGGTWSMSRQ